MRELSVNPRVVNRTDFHRQLQENGATGRAGNVEILMACLFIGFVISFVIGLGSLYFQCSIFLAIGRHHYFSL